MKLLIVLIIGVAVAAGESIKYYDTEACVQFFKEPDFEQPLYDHCKLDTDCYSVWEEEKNAITSFRIYNSGVGITLYDDWGCNGQSNYYNPTDICTEDLGGSLCEQQLNKKTLSWRLSFYEYPFEAFDPQGVREMNLPGLHRQGDFARCVQFSRSASNYSLRYCDQGGRCGRMPESWKTNEVTSIGFDGLVGGVETFESSDCSGSSDVTSCNHPYGVYQTTKNISNVPIRSFKIQGEDDISGYIGNSIYSYSFRIDETNFPSTTEILKIQLEKAPEFSKSIVFKIASKIPKMGEALAALAAIESMFTPDAEGEWKKEILEKIPEAIDKGRAEDAFTLIRAHLITINDNIRLFKSNLTEDKFASINLIMNNDLSFVVNYMLTSKICKQFPLYFMNPIQSLATLVEIHYHLIDDDLRTSANVLLNNTIRLISDFHDLGVDARINKIDLKRLDKDKVKEIINAPYAEYSSYFDGSKRIDCMPNHIRGRDCIWDDLASVRICAHTDAVPCHEAYAKLVKYRFEQAYAPITETGQRILSLVESNDRPVLCSCSYTNSIMKH